MPTSKTRHDQPPGPTGFDVARWFKRMSENTFRAFIELSRDYGDFVRFPFTPTRDAFICAHPDDVKHVLQDNHRNYKKAYTYEFLKPVVGEGLLTAEGDHWLRQRRLVAPMFHRQRIRTFADSMVETTEEMLDRWDDRPEDEPVDIAAEMSRLTLSVAGKLLFNRDIGRESDRIGEHMMLLFRDVNRRITSPLSLPRQVPTPHNRKVQNAIDSLEEIVFEMIDERTEENPVQVLVRAIENSAPREETVRLKYGGISVPKAVDTGPQRRVDQALKFIGEGTYRSSFKSPTDVSEALAREIIGAADYDVQTYAIGQKEEKERVAAAAR